MKISLGAKTLLYPTPVLMVGTYDEKGMPNIMTAAWGGICCSQPPCVTISLRKATYTHGNLLRGKVFTISVPSVDQVEEADYAGMESGRSKDKFKTSGLTPVKGDHVDAPYVAEFPMVLECKVVQVHELGSHTQFIGEIIDVKVEGSCLDGDVPSVERIRPLCFSPGIGCYHTVGARIAQGFEVGKRFTKK